MIVSHHGNSLVVNYAKLMLFAEYWQMKHPGSDNTSSAVPSQLASGPQCDLVPGPGPYHPEENKVGICILCMHHRLLIMIFLQTLPVCFINEKPYSVLPVTFIVYDIVVSTVKKLLEQLKVMIDN